MNNLRLKIGIVLIPLINITGQINGKNAFEKSHASSVDPDYSIVFPNNKINRIDIRVDEDVWAEMQADLELNMESSGRRPQGPPPERPRHAGQTFPEREEGNTVKHHPVGMPNPRPGEEPRKPQMNNDSILFPRGDLAIWRPGLHPEVQEYTPVWGQCEILFNELSWSKVGIRFKGNSSLNMTYREGLKKLSFKLDFDQFEDSFPEVKNQRFFGFKQLNLNNNFEDPSFIREKVASDLMSRFGITTAKTAFYEVYLDHGTGPQYFGLYTMVEEVDDSLLKKQYANQKGNLYKPDGYAATFSKGSFSKTDMNKKSNKKVNDFSDVQHLNAILNSPLRLSDPDRWKKELSAVFDVPVFLKWLAANTVMQNWDSYGNSTHNFYLYHNESTDKLEWIPWDNNETFNTGKMGGALSLSMDEVGDNWPLIRYVLNDDNWKAEYRNNVSNFSEDIFNPTNMFVIYDSYQKLLEEKVLGKSGEIPDYSFLKKDSDFFNAFVYLKKQVQDRNLAVSQFCTKQL